jgi:hypothetical protein
MKKKPRKVRYEDASRGYVYVVASEVYSRYGFLRGDTGSNREDAYG